MANDVVSFTVLFPLCRQYLDEQLKPLHYEEITRGGIQLLGIPEEQINFQRQKEDVREKMLQAGMHGTFYTGEPYFYGCVRDWFTGYQLPLFNPDVFMPVVIPGSATSGVTGAFEGIMRFPHMIAKNESVPQRLRAFGCARGLVIEQHVYDWFKTQWPSMVFPPGNAGQWAKHCDHDFRVKLPNGKMLEIDVWGPSSRNGLYTKPKYKKSTHLHLQCRIDETGHNVIWESVVVGDGYENSDTSIPLLGKSPKQMIVWLNCIRDGIQYDDIKASVQYVKMPD